MGGGSSLREVGDLGWIGDIETVGRHLAALSLAGLRCVGLGLADLGGDGLQSGLVAVGQRQIAAARGQFKRERPADPARSAGYGGDGPTDCSHKTSSYGQCAGDNPAVGTPYTEKLLGPPSVSIAASGFSHAESRDSARP